uniref:Orf170 n=1 Tax=Zancudomyces culisetae TaxID=1213189 RepID=Q3T4B7_ZANCU|nr:orf170 [Zancudomyces culisetae]AAW49497.1 orf170 [Zancudomyces culisetae]
MKNVKLVRDLTPVILGSFGIVASIYNNERQIQTQKEIAKMKIENALLNNVENKTQINSALEDFYNFIEIFSQTQMIFLYNILFILVLSSSLICLYFHFKLKSFLDYEPKWKILAFLFKYYKNYLYKFNVGFYSLIIFYSIIILLVNNIYFLIRGIHFKYFSNRLRNLLQR